MSKISPLTKQIRLHQHRVTSGDGLTISVFEKKPVKSDMRVKPILLLHSATFSSIPEYDLQVDDYSLMDYFAKRGCSVFAVDIRGYGASQRPPSNDWITAKVAVQDVHSAVKFIQKMKGRDSIILLGWSWGSQVGGLYAQIYPESVDSLILYAPFWNVINADIPELQGRRRENTRQDIIGDFLDMSYVDSRVVDEFARQCMIHDRTSSLGSWLDLKNLNTDPILEPSKINVPTLIIYGEYDHLVDRDDLRNFYAKLNSQRKEIVVVPNTDHMTHLEHNHRLFKDSVINFIESLS